MSAPRLYLIADYGYLGDDAAWLERLADVAVAVHAHARSRQLPATMFQLRTKGVQAPHREGLLIEGLDVTRRAGIPVLLNGTEEEARALHFDGVHWPEGKIPAVPSTAAGARQPADDDESTGGGERSSAEPLATPDHRAPDPRGSGDTGRRRFVRGASIHSVDALQRAEVAGADFALFGPVFDPGAHPGKGVGIDALRDVVERAEIPVVAIGGIDAGNARDCMQAGAAGVAVVSAAFDPDRDAVEAVDVLLAAVEGS